MSIISDILVYWTPETSGRVASAQIRSRIAGDTNWTEQAAAADPTSGSFRFTANAPDSDVEVQIRYRMMSGVFSPWLAATVHTQAISIDYKTLADTPTRLSDINTTEGTKLGGVEDGATKGAILGRNIYNNDKAVVAASDLITSQGTSKDTAAVGGVSSATLIANQRDKDGNLVTVIALQKQISDAQTAAANAATAQLNQAKSDLNTAITAAQSDATQARADIKTAADNLTNEINRAKSAEGATNTTLANLNTTVGNNYSEFKSTVTQLVTTDSSLSSKLDSISTTVGNNKSSVDTQIGVLTTNDQTTASQINTINSRSGGGNILSNTDFVIDASGWTYQIENGSNGARETLTDASWWPAGMHPLIISQADSTARGGHWSQFVYGIEPSQVYQFTAWNATHRCQAGLYIDWFNSAGTNVGQTNITDPATGNAGNRLLSDFRRIILTATAPATAAYCRVYLIKYGTYSGQANSYAWFLQPQFVKVRAGVTEAVPYTSGSGNSSLQTVTASVSSLALTVTTNNSALSGRIDTVSSNLGSTNSALSSEVTARNDGDKSLGARIDTTQAQYRPNPNLAPDLSNWTGGSVTVSPLWGQILYFNGVANTPTPMAISPSIPLAANTTYTLSGDVLSGNYGTCYIDMILYDVNSNNVADTSNVGTTGSDFSNDRAIGVLAGTFVTPSNCVRGVIRAIIQSTTQDQASNFGIRRVKLERGSSATVYSNDQFAVDTTAKITTNATTAANATAAVASRTSTIEAQLNNTAASGLQSRIKAAEDAQTTNLATTASKLSSLESRAGNDSTYSNSNANFSAWPDSSVNPSQWGNWGDASGGTIQRLQPAFTAGNNTCRMAAKADLSFGLSQSFYLNVGTWVLEGSAWLSAGSWQGAGIYVDNYNILNFATTATTNGFVGNPTDGGIRNWSVMFTSTSAQMVNLYIMSNWDGFGARAAKTIDFLKAGIRPASDGEIQAAKATANIASAVARLGTLETTTAQTDSALANRATTMETSLQGAAQANNIAALPYAFNVGDFTSFNPPIEHTAAKIIAAQPTMYTITNGRFRVSNNGQAHVGPVAPVRILPNRVYRFRAVGRGVSVAGGNQMENLISCFDANGQYISYDFRGGPLWRTDADTVQTFTLSMTQGMGADATFLNYNQNVAYAKPVIIARASGGDVTDLFEVSLTDVTDTVANQLAIVSTNAKLSTVESTAATNINAVANRTTTLEAATQSNTNLCPDIQLWSANYYVDPLWGPNIRVFDSFNAIRVISQSPRIPIAGNCTYTVSADLCGIAGSVYVDLIVCDASGNVLLDGPNDCQSNPAKPDYAARPIGTYKSTLTTPANTSYGVLRVVAIGNGNAGGAYGARLIKLEVGAVATAYTNDSATAGTLSRLINTEATFSTQISANATRSTNLEARAGSLESRVSAQEGATSNLATKVSSAWSEKTVSAGSSAATITMRALDDNGVATSDVTLAASRIALRNVDSGAVVKGGMVISGGAAVFDGAITAAGGILVGTGKLKVQVASQDYSVSNGDQVSFGYDLGRAPSVTFGPCPVALNSGEIYSPYALNLTSTGFTANLVIIAAPQSQGQSTGAFSNSGSNQYDASKSGKANAANGQYTLTVNLSATANAIRDTNY